MPLIMTQPDYMLSEILEQPAILHSILQDPKVNQVAESIKNKGIKKIIFTGCGDSYCAAWYGAYLANHWCPQYQARYYEPFELVNYSSPEELKNAVVMGISVSGGTLRVLEAMRFAKNHGSTTVTITDNPKGKMVRETDQTLLINASPPESLLTTSYSSKVAKQYVGYQNDVAQTKTYIANLGVLSVLLAHLSPRRSENIEKIQVTFSLVKEALEQREKLIQVSKSFKETSENIIFVGSGPNSPTSLFGAYKMFEFTLHGFSCDIEEYCHTSYFITTDKSTVIFLAPDQQSYDRIMEIEPVVREQISARTLIIANRNLVKSQVQYVFPLVMPQDSYLSPLVLSVPIELISYSLAQSRGFNTNTFRGGIETEKYVAGSYNTIRQSRLRY